MGLEFFIYLKKLEKLKMGTGLRPHAHPPIGAVQLFAGFTRLSQILLP